MFGASRHLVECNAEVAKLVKTLKILMYVGIVSCILAIFVSMMSGIFGFFVICCLFMATSQENAVDLVMLQQASAMSFFIGIVSFISALVSVIGQPIPYWIIFGFLLYLSVFFAAVARLSWVVFRQAYNCRPLNDGPAPIMGTAPAGYSSPPQQYYGSQPEPPAGNPANAPGFTAFQGQGYRLQ